VDINVDDRPRIRGHQIVLLSLTWFAIETSLRDHR
jgi:hypothetical protein